MNLLFATPDSKTNPKRNLPQDSTLTTRFLRSPLVLGSMALAIAATTLAPQSVFAQSATLAQDAPAQQAEPDDAPPAMLPDAGLMPSTVDDKGLPNHELTSQIVFQVLAAEVALQRGQPAPAYQTYLSMARSTKDPRMAQRAAEIAVSAQSPSDALTAARLWHEYAPNSDSATQFDATLLVLNGYLNEAQPLLARQLASTPSTERGEAILSLQTLISRGPDRIGGVQTLRQLLSADMQRPEALTAIGRQQIVANDAPGARVSFTAALKLQPNYGPAALLLAQLGADERHDAIAIVYDYTQQHPSEHDARFVLAQLYLADNQIDHARTQFETLHKADPNDAAPLFALGLLSLQAKQNKEAEKYFVAYADQARKQAGQPGQSRIDGGPAYLYLAQIAAERKDLAGADKWLAQVDQNSSQYVSAQIARAELLSAQKRYDAAMSILAGVQPRNGREAIALGRADAGLLMQAGRYPQAEQRLAALLSLVPNDPDVMYDYAMAAERNGHYKQMEEQLRHLIAIDPTNAQAYNALGYSMTDRGDRLPEADKLIQKAMVLSPDDPYITDSAGWVKYKLGDKDQAVVLLRRAYQLQPNAEIGAHLGEVLWSQGKQDEARQVLRAAQHLDPTDDTLVQTMTRLKVSQQ